MMLSDVSSITRDWLKHAAVTDKEFQNSTIQEFYRFFFYFVPFNAQYTAIARYLKAHNYNNREDLELFNKDGTRIQDKKSAIDGVQEFLAERKRLALFDEVVVSRGRKEGQNAVSTLATLISGNQFHIHIRYDREVNYVEDRKLVVKLKSEDSAQRVKGVLTVIYQVRCNMFHGQKRLIATQQELLIPINDLLKALTTRLQLALDNRSEE